MTSSVDSLLKLRLLVGFLGERAQFSWWPTAFYGNASQQFLEPVFTKTFRLAQYHGVVEAARRQHDEFLSVGSYHLFRLPEEREQDLHAAMQALTPDHLAAVGIHSKETALGALKRFAGSTSLVAVGPTSIGNIKDLDDEPTSQKIAGAYLSAFSNNVKTIPYLVREP